MQLGNWVLSAKKVLSYQLETGKHSADILSGQKWSTVHDDYMGSCLSGCLMPKRTFHNHCFVCNQGNQYVVKTTHLFL